MKNSPIKYRSTLPLKVSVVLIGIGMLAFLLGEPHMEGRNANSTLFEIYFNDPLLLYVYLGSVAFFVALYQTFKLLKLIEENKVFSEEAMHALEIIKYCAIAIIGFDAIGAMFILITHGVDPESPGALFFLSLLVGLPSFVVVICASLFGNSSKKTTMTK